MLTARSDDLDLTRSTVFVAWTSTTTERKAVEMLLDEVERRTGVRWNVGKSGAEAAGVSIWIGLHQSIAAQVRDSTVRKTQGSEGFQNGVTNSVCCTARCRTRRRWPGYC